MGKNYRILIQEDQKELASVTEDGKVSYDKSRIPELMQKVDELLGSLAKGQKSISLLLKKIAQDGAKSKQ